MACQLLLHLCLCNIFPPHVLQNFSRYPITSTINRFHSTKFPLWKLGYVLDEEWLQDEVLGGLAELVYLKAAATAVPDNSTPSRPPAFLYLPTNILSEAWALFSQTGQQDFGPNLGALQQWIQNMMVIHMAFLDCAMDHYSGYLWQDSNTCSTETHCIVHQWAIFYLSYNGFCSGLKPIWQLRLNLESWIYKAEVVVIVVVP